jgi:ABC transport system ATP-binding/permease protein
LLKVLLGSPNVLILDEPTNDLDVQTLSVLEEYLESFNGCVIVVSHDRYFLDRTVQTIFELQPGGNIQNYPGNYSVYLECKKAEAAEEKQAATATKKPEAAPAAVATTTEKARKLSFKEKREYEQLEVAIPKLEADKVALEKTLYETPPEGYSEVKKMTDKLAHLEKEIGRSTERWLELAEYV